MQHYMQTLKLMQNLDYKRAKAGMGIKEISEMLLEMHNLWEKSFAEPSKTNETPAEQKPSGKAPERNHKAKFGKASRSEPNTSAKTSDTEPA